MKMSHIYSNLQPPGVWVRWSKTAGTFYIYQCYHSAKKNSEHVISVSYSLRDSEWNLASAASVVKINSLIVLMPLICICCLYLRSPPHIVTHDSHKLLWTLRTFKNISISTVIFCIGCALRQWCKSEVPSLSVLSESVKFYITMY